MTTSGDWYVANQLLRLSEHIKSIGSYVALHQSSVSSFTLSDFATQPEAATHSTTDPSLMIQTQPDSAKLTLDTMTRTCTQPADMALSRRIIKETERLDSDPVPGIRYS